MSVCVRVSYPFTDDDPEVALEEIRLGLDALFTATNDLLEIAQKIVAQPKP